MPSPLDRMIAASKESKKLLVFPERVLISASVEFEIPTCAFFRLTKGGCAVIPVSWKQFAAYASCRAHSILKHGIGENVDIDILDVSRVKD